MPFRRVLLNQHISAMLSASTALVNGAGRCSISSTAAAPALHVRHSSTASKFCMSTTSSSCTAMQRGIGRPAVTAAATARHAVATTSSWWLPQRSIRCFASGDPRSENPDNPTINDLEAGLSSEAVGIDTEAIDAIPASSMPAGAQRTEVPGPGSTQHKASGGTSLSDLEANISSEAVGIDTEAIDAIPASSLPPGAQRTEGPE